AAHLTRQRSKHRSISSRGRFGGTSVERFLMIMFSFRWWASKEIIMFSFLRRASKGKSETSNAPVKGAPMKVRIDRAACAGNARCAAVSAELFPLNADGYIDTPGFDVPKGMEQLARRGARACPERVITVIEDDK